MLGERRENTPIWTKGNDSLGLKREKRASGGSLEVYESLVIDNVMTEANIREAQYE